MNIVSILTKPIFKIESSKTENKSNNIREIYRKNRERFGQDKKTAILKTIWHLSTGKDLQKELVNLVIRIVIFFISTAWFSFYPAYLFILYMYQRHFFSYDLFLEGFFGMRTFIFILLIIFVVLSFIQFGFIICFFAAIKNARNHGKIMKTDRVMFYLFFIFSVLFNYIFFLIFLTNNNLYDLSLLSALSFLICVFIASFIQGKTKSSLLNWTKPAFLILTTAFIPFVYIEQTTNSIDMTLRNFRVGGGIPVSIYRKSDNNLITDGKLLLHAPNITYIRNENTLVTVPHNQDVKIVISND